MASGKMTPRQKMINMMYLVLTALLALNVSKEVLNSFFEVNLGIVKTTNGLDKKNTETYDAKSETTPTVTDFNLLLIIFDELYEIVGLGNFLYHFFY